MTRLIIYTDMPLPFGIGWNAIGAHVVNILFVPADEDKPRDTSGWRLPDAMTEYRMEWLKEGAVNYKKHKIPR